MVVGGILVGAFMLLFAYCACVVSSGCSRYEEEYLYEKEFEFMKKKDDKIYVLIDESIWNNESNINIIGSSNIPKIAESLFAEHVKKVKEEIDFYELDVLEDTGEEIDKYKEYTFEETEDYFLIYKTGYYDNNHILIKIEEVSLTNELEGELVI